MIITTVIIVVHFSVLPINSAPHGILSSTLFRIILRWFSSPFRLVLLARFALLPCSRSPLRLTSRDQSLWQPKPRLAESRRHWSAKALRSADRWLTCSNHHCKNLWSLVQAGYSRFVRAHKMASCRWRWCIALVFAGIETLTRVGMLSLWSLLPSEKPVRFCTLYRPVINPLV